MSRSLKKGPFIDTPLLEKIEAMNRTQEKKVLDHLTLTLDRLALGGIYDQLGGGFHRYSTTHPRPSDRAP